MNKFLVRSVSGVVFVLVVLAGLLLNKFLFAALAAFMALGMLWELYHICKDRSRLLVWTLYIVLSMSLFLLLGFKNGYFSGKYLLVFFILIWSSDVGAFCAGSLLGKHCSRKLAPSISPNKTWAGFWGGLCFAVLAAVIIWSAGSSPFKVSTFILLAIIVHCSGVCGDLLESSLKRKCGVKDSGNIIPGHGGLLDRFDSSLLAIPCGTLFLLVSGLLFAL